MWRIVLLGLLACGCTKKTQAPPPGSAPTSRPAEWQEVQHSEKSDTDKAVDAASHRTR